MLLNPLFHHRIKHFDLLLAKELSSIEREHVQNIFSHQRFENSIRQSFHQTSIKDRKKLSIPFNEIYNEQTESIDYHRLRLASARNPSENDKSRRSSFSNPSDDGLSHRRGSISTTRLPPIIKANINHRQQRESKQNHWMNNFQDHQTKKSVDPNETFSMWDDETTSIHPFDQTPMDKQIRSFLNTLPTYQGVQKGFDSFAESSLYSNRKPIVIR